MSVNEIKTIVNALSYVDCCRQDNTLSELYNEILQTPENQWTSDVVEKWIIILENHPNKDNNRLDLIHRLRKIING